MRKFVVFTKELAKKKMIDGSVRLFKTAFGFLPKAVFHSLLLQLFTKAYFIFQTFGICRNPLQIEVFNRKLEKLKIYIEYHE